MKQTPQIRCFPPIELRDALLCRSPLLFALEVGKQRIFAIAVGEKPSANSKAAAACTAVHLTKANQPKKSAKPLDIQPSTEYNINMHDYFEKD